MYLPVISGVILFVALGIIIITQTTITKTPATIEEVKNVLISQGYETFDHTENINSEYPDTELIQCVVTQKEDLHFEFYLFSTDAGAQSIYRQAYNLLVTTKRGYPYGVFTQLLFM